MLASNFLALGKSYDWLCARVTTLKRMGTCATRISESTKNLWTVMKNFTNIDVHLPIICTGRRQFAAARSWIPLCLKQHVKTIYSVTAVSSLSKFSLRSTTTRAIYPYSPNLDIGREISRVCRTAVSVLHTWSMYFETKYVIQHFIRSIWNNILSIDYCIFCPYSIMLALFRFMKFYKMYKSIVKHTEYTTVP